MRWRAQAPLHAFPGLALPPYACSRRRNRGSIPDTSDVLLSSRVFCSSARINICEDLRLPFRTAACVDVLAFRVDACVYTRVEIDVEASSRICNGRGTLGRPVVQVSF